MSSKNIVRNTVTISDIIIGNKFEQERNGVKTGIIIQPVNINICERLSQFKYEDDEKVEKHIRQINVNMSDFTRLLTKASWVGHIKLSEVDTTGKTESQILNEQYEDHISCLNGASLTFEREEILDTVPDESKPITDEQGNPKLDENGEQMYEPMTDKDGKPIKKLIGYGEMNIIKVELSPEGAELAKDFAKNKKRK